MIRFIQFYEEGALPGQEYASGAVQRCLDKLNEWHADIKARILHIQPNYLLRHQHDKIRVIFDVFYEDSTPFEKSPPKNGVPEKQGSPIILDQ